MTKQSLIVLQLNYSTPNWIYVVLSRVTSLDGLFLLQPIKEDYNPQPSKLLREEWKNQRDKEIELLLFLQKSGNFPEEVNVHDVALKLNHGNAQSDKCNTSSTYSNTTRTRISRKYTSFSPSIISRNTITSSKYDSWFLQHQMRIESHLSRKNGNCLFESLLCFIDDWKGKPFYLQLKSITWAQKQVSQGTSWGMSMWRKFDKTKVNIDCYNKNSYMEYLEFMKTPTAFGTEYGIIMLCEFLKVSIKVFSPSLFSDKQGMCHGVEPVHFGDAMQTLISLWLSNENYEPIINI